MNKVIGVVVGIVLGVVGTWMLTRPASPEVDAAAAERGATHYQVCAACHGKNGEGNLDTGAPRIAGQHGWYLERQLMNFRAGARGVDSLDLNGQVMRPMALGLPDDAAVKDVVAYIQTLR